MISLYDSALQKQKWKAERVLSPRAAPLGKFGNVQYAPPDATAAGPRLSGMRKFLCSVRAALTALTCRLSMSPARRVALRDQGQRCAVDRHMANLLGCLTGCALKDKRGEDYRRQLRNAWARLERTGATPAMKEAAMVRLISEFQSWDRSAVAAGIARVLREPLPRQQQSWLGLLNDQVSRPIPAGAAAGGRPVSGARSASPQDGGSVMPPSGGPLDAASRPGLPAPVMEHVTGDITRINVDAIVNAAKPSLLGGGGVDGAIHQAAGPGLLAECAKLGGCEVGRAKITAGHRLPARHVIHTVGPVWQGGGNNEAAKLASCYRESIRLAVKKGLGSIAFPAISTGVYGYPRKEAAAIAVAAVRQAMQESEGSSLRRVVFCCYDDEDARLHRQLLSGMRQP